MYKEYKIKIKMVQEQWLQLKMKFVLAWKLLFKGWKYSWWTGRETSESLVQVGGRSLLGGIFPGEERMS